MNINDLLKLINAGYTKADIEALGMLGAAPDQEQEQPGDQQEQPETQAQPAAAPEQPAPAQPDRMQQLETKLDYVINRFNLMAVQQSAQPAAQEETVDDILASVVRGFKKDE